MIRMNRLLWAAASDKGAYREKNQDRLFCREVNTSIGNVLLACVCDGVGSFENSEHASEMVIQGLKLWIEGLLKKRLICENENDLLDDLNSTISELNQLIYEKQKKENERLGCTMSLLLIVDKQYHIIHVGDSRIYTGETTLEQITVDDVSISEIDGRKRLKKCMGLKSEVDTFRTSGKLNSDTVFFLGSDGAFNLHDISSYIGPMHKADTQERLESVCKCIIQDARNLGETDNISCVLVQNCSIVSLSRLKEVLKKNILKNKIYKF